MNTSKYRVLILGGLQGCELEGTPESSDQVKQYITRFVEASDVAVLNLGVALPNRANGSTLDKTSRAFVREQYAALGPTLSELGIDVVNLANTHIAGFSEEELQPTLEWLDHLGLGRFGAGGTLKEARAPFRLPLPPAVGGGEIHLHGSVIHEGEFNESGAQCAPLHVAGVPPARTDFATRDSLQVAIPDWGTEVAWRSHRQFALAHRFLSKDYDLVVGAGRCLQEVHRKRERWVVYGIGGSGPALANGQSSGGQSSEAALPFNLWAILEVHRRGGVRVVDLKLYPVYESVENNDSRYGPVSSADFERVVRVLRERPIRPWRFTNPALSLGADNLGNYLNLYVGTWPIGGKPARLDSPLTSGDPGEWPFKGPSPEIEDRVLALDKHLGAAGFALEAEDHGGKTRWLAPHVGVIQTQGKSILTHGYWAHESATASAIVADKVLTADLLEKRGVNTPSTVVVRSEDEAVRAAEELGYPVVLKPRSGNKSRGVSTRLVDEQAIRDAFTFARRHGSEVIAQQHVEAAEELRVMASAKQAVATIKRLLPHVVGDGCSTIKQLIEDKNLQRTLNPSLVKRSIPLDSQTRLELENRGFSLASVPEFGEEVTVRGVAGLSVGADALQAFELTDEEVLNTAAAAVAAIPGLDWGGVDMIVEKSTGRPYVIEINTAAGYGQALFPSYGQPRNVAAEAWALRLASTETPASGAPETGKINETPRALFTETGQRSRGALVSLGQLVHESLERQGYSLQQRSQNVFELLSPTGIRTWLKGDGATSADRRVVLLVVKRHEWVLKLLDDYGIPRPRARRVTSVAQLRRFTEGRVGHVTLMPASAPWGGPSTRRLTHQEVLEQDNIPGKMLVQARPRGRRVRVLASDTKAWLVSVHAKEKRIEPEHVHLASRMAVEAVRAVPELRWAAVDLVIRAAASHEGQLKGVLVEGITTRPEYSIEDLVLAGEFDDFCLSIV